MCTNYNLTFSIVFGLIYTVFGLYEQCNHEIELKSGQKIFINSPYYPGQYPIGTSCRYTVKAPMDHQLSFKCTLQTNTPATATRCRHEIFYFNREGSELLSGSEFFCGSGTIERKSFLNRAVISYISMPAHVRNTPAELIHSVKAGVANSNGYLPTKTTAAPATIATTADYKVPVEEEVGVRNPLAYIEAFLFNVYKRNTTTRTTTTTTTTTSTTTRPLIMAALENVKETVLHDFIPSLLWRNASSYGASKVPEKVASTTKRPKRRRKPKIIVDRDLGFVSNFSATANGKQNFIYPSFSAGGGSFSCLVEAVEPAECECGWSMAELKIAGSRGQAAVNEFPSMAGVTTRRYRRVFCGAAIIHHRYLLSAAHCFITPETNRSELIRVVVGEHDIGTVLETPYTRTYDIEAIIPHENFRTSTSKVNNDIALLRTSSTMDWNRGVGPACLPSLSWTSNDGSRKPPIAGQRLETAGWGTTYFGGPQSTLLLKTTLDVISTEQCKRAVKAVPTAAFCTYTPGTDTCQYDSGGALYIRNERLFAVGIVSYGFACASQQPSINMRVSSFARWIQRKTPEVKYCIKELKT